jgi:hypothetical protein
MQTAVVVAVIAALASAGAAVLAWLSSRSADRSAREVVSVNHRVASLDREAELLRNDYRDFIRAIGGLRGMKDVGALLSTQEILMANPRCNEALRTSSFNVCRSLQQQTYRASQMLASTVRGVAEDDMTTMREALAQCLAEIRTERMAVLEGVSSELPPLPG